MLTSYVPKGHFIKFWWIHPQNHISYLISSVVLTLKLLFQQKERLLCDMTRVSFWKDYPVFKWLGRQD